MSKVSPFLHYQMIKNSLSKSLPLVRIFPHFSLVTFLSVILLFTLFGCKGGKKNNPGTPTNADGGYTLVASGGTLNDGSGAKGLSLLVTLRDGSGWGPTLPWTITITGPGISSPLVVDYSDPRLGSFMTWEWASFDPVPGTYRATATDGSTTIYDDFTITSSVLSRPAPNASSSGSDIKLTWPSIDGAGSYAYNVCDPDTNCITGYTTDTSAVVSFGTLTTGSYFIEVDAYATDLVALYANHLSSPGLAPQENISEYSFTFPVGGGQISANYSLQTAGGILDYGMRDSNNTPIYALAIWTSIQDLSTNPSPTVPSGDWNIMVTDPNGLVMNYIYPANEGHNAYWYYNIEPVRGGTYTVTATYGGASESAAFSFANTNPNPNLIPLSVTDSRSDISASLVSNAANANVKDISITWLSVINAKSYYISLWADVWNSSTKQYKYDEVWGNWVNTTNARVLNGSVASGLQCDVYVTACQIDMTSPTPPQTAPTRADMSENYHGYPLPFLTP